MIMDLKESIRLGEEVDIVSEINTMKNDLVTVNTAYRNAQDKIEKLEAENAKLKDALGQLVKYKLVIQRWASKNVEPQWLDGFMSCCEYAAKILSLVKL